MVQLAGRASSLIVDSRGVQLEGVVAGIDGNRHGLLSNSGLESTLGTRGNISVSRDGGTNVGSRESALSLDTLIRVAGLGVNTTVLDDVLEGVVHQTTIATIVSVAARAISQVLFRERDKVSSGDLVDTLNGTSGRESPAVTALSLVLDGSDSTASAPVNRGGGSNSGGGKDSWELVDTGSEVGTSVLLVAQVSKHVKAELGLVVLRVPLVNIVHVVLEDGVSYLELLSSVKSLERLHPVGEFILVLLFSETTDTGDQQSSHQQYLSVHSPSLTW